MKKKPCKLVLITLKTFLLIFICNVSWAQKGSISCFTTKDSTYRANISAEGDNTDRSTSIVCDAANGFRKFIRVNVHWVLNDAGNGNFRANDDGNGNSSINGYNKAEEMINGANADLLSNQQMWLPAGNTTPKLPIGIGFILNGVYFEKSTAAGTALNSDWTVHTQFAKDAANTLNVYMIEADPTIDRDPSKAGIQTYNGGGIANQFSFSYTPGPAVKIYGAWNIYNVFSNGWNDFQVRTLQHEVGHNLNLAHTWSGNDGCDDTPNNNNCWDYNTSNPNCDSWSETSNNIMDYNGWEPAYTPCQIDRLTTEINSQRGTNYIYSCSDCVPANANFTIGTEYCGNPPIAMDCRGSFLESNYFIEIYKTSSIGSTNVISGTYFSSWYSGQAPLIANLRTIYTPGFGNGVYRIKLAVQNYRANGQFCNSWDEEVKYITSYLNTNCTPGSGKNFEDEPSEENADPVVNVFPNPTTGEVFVNSVGLNDKNCNIMITDINGRQVFNDKFVMNESLYKFNMQESGVYIVKIWNDSYSVSKKLIVAR